jgi:exo-beta-1,3-glucanase (GH17 family)
MRLPAGLFVLVTAAIAASWWWLGAPVAMPASPLAAGEKLYCVSYAPFRGAQSPLDPTFHVDAAQIEDDLTRLAPLTDCVRTYSTQNGLDQVPEIAARHGLKVIQGLWLGGDPAFNRRDIEATVALAKRYPQVIQSIVVGNEVLLRGEMTVPDLIAAIRQVKAQVPQPVTYADVWEFWLRYREVASAVDFVTVHILPYWEDWPVPAHEAVAHIDSIRLKVAEAFPGKEVLIGETGWPSAGRMREGALPSPANQARVLQGVIALAKRQNFHANLIEAFDQPWKRLLEGTVGGHWGLLDAYAREPKFVWGEAVSNHPHWRLQAAGGIALAALVFGAAGVTGRRLSSQRSTIWIAVAAVALGAGILIGWTVENAMLESLGLGGWIKSLALITVAIAGPLAGAAALVTGIATPSFAAALERTRPANALPRILGLVFIAVGVLAVQSALGFVFNPRYRDFPFAPLTAAALPFLALLLNRADGVGQVAERAMATVLALSAIYIVLNEGFANWQAVWFCAVLALLAFTLSRARGVPG